MRSTLLTVLAVSLLTPDFADAQFRFGRGNRGWGGGSGWNVGIGDGGVSFGYGNGGWGYGNGWGGYGYGRGYGWGDGWGYGRGYGYPYYGGSGFTIGFGDGYYGSGYGGYYGSSYPYYGSSYGYSYPSYSSGMVYSSPSYMSGGYMTDGSMGYMGSSNVYQAGYGSNMNMANVVRLDIIVADDNAEVTIQGQRVSGFGRHRSFVSPSLEPGKEYTYTITCRSNQAREGGEQTKKIDVKAGGQYTVDFTRGSDERIPAPAGGFDTERPRRDADILPRGDTNRDRDNNNRDRDNNNRDNNNRDRNPDRPGGTNPNPGGTNPGGSPANPPR